MKKVKQSYNEKQNPPNERGNKNAGLEFQLYI